MCRMAMAWPSTTVIAAREKATTKQVASITVLEKATPLGAGASEMCRNIRTLFNFVPPVTTEEIRAASLQFVRKISGFNKPSKANEAVFEAAVDEITEATTRLIRSLGTTAPSKDREREAARARGRAAERFGA